MMILNLSDLQNYTLCMSYFAFNFVAILYKK